MSITIAITCTDKGQHPWIALGDLTLDDGMLRANIGATYGALAETRKDQCVWLDHLDPERAEYRVHLRCPRCQRHPQWTHANAVDRLTRLHAAGLSQLDVSLMP